MMKTCSFKLLTVIVIFIKGSNGCAPGWVFFNASCYKLFNDKGTWSEARRGCEAQGSHLLTFSSAEENDFVYKTFTKSKSVWIGLHRNPVDFYWVTGEDLVYKNWIIPNGDNPDEKCVEMTDYGSYNGKWNDLGCENNLEYICEEEKSREGVFEIKRGVALYNHVISEVTSLTDMDCALQCLHTQDCKSTNYYSSFSPSFCQLNNAVMEDFSDDVIEEEDAAYYVKL
ncbi:C-type lectin lectoxin-Lio2-like isoform X2 [Actinia tenebrosa]|uniref:C-type lectin lectoxin-Lio2-like isoform X2 n=1 Tax=Actinia tenebrosa TaxID=6105 RepID=A0A6P8J6A0_ACTTE|nr:C-type lectin lectoxin-Lio2-like isoform X2 [Actinia tenebrosa]